MSVVPVRAETSRRRTAPRDARQDREQQQRAQAHAQEHQRGPQGVYQPRRREGQRSQGGERIHDDFPVMTGQPLPLRYVNWFSLC